MKQSRPQALREAVAGTAIGFVVTMICNWIIYPWFDLHLNLQTNLGLTIVFTFISVVRGYFVRRLFDCIHHRGL